MFHDRASIRVVAGRGGDGALSVRREKFVPRGGPDGGDGGRGGDVVLVADPDLRDLTAFRTKATFRGGRGGNGGGNRRHGANGEDVVLAVPVGTQVWSAGEDELLVDLASPGRRERQAPSRTAVAVVVPKTTRASAIALKMPGNPQPNP